MSWRAWSAGAFGAIDLYAHVFSLEKKLPAGRAFSLLFVQLPVDSFHQRPRVGLVVFISLEVSSSLSRAPAAGPDAEDRQAKYTSPKRASGRLGAAGAKRGDEVRAAVKRERPPVLKVICIVHSLSALLEPREASPPASLPSCDAAFAAPGSTSRSGPAAPSAAPGAEALKRGSGG